jgi:hypothetical protein
MAIIISSKRSKARRITFSWPLVMGSNDPGNTAIFFMNAEFIRTKPLRQN